jgi:hypothetical protein
MNMFLIEGLIITGILFYVASCALKETKPKVFLKKFFFCATAAWMAEESCIMLYGIYTYGPVWNFFVADVPLVVIIVWPAIILSATVLSSCLLTPNSSLIPLVAGAIVLTDAMLIEPISVNFNLWRWHQPGLFGVPLIGFLGWAYFAVFSVGFFVPIGLLSRIKLRLPIMLVVSVIGTHLCLLISYWAFFKWNILSLSPTFSSGAIWIVSVIIFSIFLFSKIGDRVELKTLLFRLPAAIFFYILLFIKKDSPMPLIVYSLAFILPYIAILVRSNCSWTCSTIDRNTSGRHS